MDGYSAIGNERWLRRFIARLLSFAGLAEEAAGRSAPVRWLMLWILRRAETLMTEVVFDFTGAPPPPLERLAPVGNEPADALRLAARFLALAEALVALLLLTHRSDCRLNHRSGRYSFAFVPMAAAFDRPFGFVAPRPADTS